MPDAEWTVISAVKDTLPAPKDFDGYIITGRTHSVFEVLDWQDRLFDFIRDVHRKEVKMAGGGVWSSGDRACLGRKCGPQPQGMGRWYYAGVSDRRHVFAKAGEVMLHAMHQDQVSQTPEGAEIFLSSDFCPVSGFTIDLHFPAIQQHPDFNPDTNRDLINKRINRISSAVADPALASCDGPDNTGISVEWMADFLLPGQ